MITVRVQPGEKILKVLKKRNPAVTADMSFNNAFLNSDEFLEAQCKEKGNKKTIMKKEGEKSACILSVLQHDGGYVFLFENKEKKLVLDAYMCK